MSAPIGILGGGAWATALGAMLCAKGEAVTLWARDGATVEEINGQRRNSRYLSDVALPEDLVATQDFAKTVAAAVLLYVAPAQSLRELLPQIAAQEQRPKNLVLCAKGIDRISGLLPHQLVAQALPDVGVAALSGPSFAVDVATGLPTAVSLAADTIEAAEALAERLSSPAFRIYAGDDLTGVEAGGALKNVLAIAVGISRGLELGASAEAALIARGFAELSRLAVILGARRETLSGLSGLGDLVLTCSSPKSRNFAYGVALAEGRDLAGLPLAEGVYTVSVARRIAADHGVDVPVIEAVDRVLSGEISAREAVDTLLARPLRSEY